MIDIFWLAIGLTAAFLTMFAFIPQMIKILKTKHVRDISLIMLAQTGLGAFFWIIYGLHISDPIVIMANIISFSIIVIIIGLFFKYRFHNGEEREPQ